MEISYRRQLRKLRKEKLVLTRRIGELEPESTELMTKRARLGALHDEIEGLETDFLLKRIETLGIELPKGKSSWWRNDIEYSDFDDVRFYLTSTGKRYVNKLIRDERKKNIEWWIKLVGGLIPMLTALAGTIAAILAVLSKWSG